MTRTEAIGQFHDQYFHPKSSELRLQLNEKLANADDDFIHCFIDLVDKTLSLLLAEQQKTRKAIYSIELSVLLHSFLSGNCIGYIEAYQKNWYLGDPVFTIRVDLKKFFGEWAELYQDSLREAKKYVILLKPSDVSILFLDEVACIQKAMGKLLAASAGRICLLDSLQKLEKEPGFFIGAGYFRQMTYFFGKKHSNEDFVYYEG